MAYILVVDDGPVVRGVTRRFLENAAHEIEGVGDGKEALTRLRGRSADLVIADVYMGRNGWDRTPSGDPPGSAGGPSADVSGGGRRGGPPFLDVTKALGAVSALTKPFDEEPLLAEVVRMLATDRQTAP